MDKKKRNLGILKILFTLVLWLLPSMYENLYGPIDKPSIVYFIPRLSAIILFFNGLFQLGKSRNLSKLPPQDPLTIEKKYKVSKKLIYLGLLAGLGMFFIAIIFEPESYSFIGGIWGISMLVSMFGLVGLKKKGRGDKAFYPILICVTYAGTFIAWALIGLSKWTW